MWGWGITTHDHSSLKVVRIVNTHTHLFNNWRGAGLVFPVASVWMCGSVVPVLQPVLCAKYIAAWLRQFETSSYPCHMRAACMLCQDSGLLTRRGERNKQDWEKESTVCWCPQFQLCLEWNQFKCVILSQDTCVILTSPSPLSWLLWFCM